MAEHEGLNVGEDRAWALTRDQAVAYAVACSTRATEAEHDAAVLGLLQHVGLDLHDAVQVLAKDVRPDRPDDHSATTPLAFTVGIGKQVGPFLKMLLDGRQTEHAAGVLNILAVADLDANLHRALTGVMGVDAQRARGLVETLLEHWPAAGSPRRISS